MNLHVPSIRTSADVDLLPVAVQDARLDQAIGATPVLKVQLQVAPQAAPALLLAQGDVDHVLDGEPVVVAEVDFAGVEVVLDELEEGVDLQRDAFLRGGRRTCDFDSRISSRDRPVCSSSSSFRLYGRLISF